LHSETIFVDQKNSFAGIPLSPPAVNLLATVEKLYGKSVREELMRNWNLSRYGSSYITIDGAPVVQLNFVSGRTESSENIHVAELILKQIKEFNEQLRLFLVKSFKFEYIL